MSCLIERAPVLLLLTLLLGGCNLLPGDTSPTRVDPVERATGHYRERLLEAEGWRVWRQVDNYRATCVTLKPAVGGTWPVLNESRSLPSGGAGFYMIRREGWAQPLFGFYGQHPHDKVSRAWLDGAPVDPSGLDEVLAWEGRTVEFTVSTLPAPQAYDEAQTQRATLDFSGVRRAREAFRDCRDVPRPAPSLRYGSEGDN
ncbi:MAG: hypothetical protein R3202_01525 [Candidatus Competibacterales bacterium]|nr:hypothetical protein [Candidatus Competibacterales bacterium]